MLNEAARGLHPREVREIPKDWAGIGNANATLGIAGEQSIAGLSRLDIPTRGGDNGVSDFTNTKTVQFTEKLSLFRGRHQAKFGGRWLYQRQQFANSGSFGVLGEFDYFGAFTGFGFSDFLLDAVNGKGLSGLVPPFTQLAHRVGIFAQDDVRVRDNLTLNLGLSWEYLRRWWRRTTASQLSTSRRDSCCLAGKDGNSRALYDPFYGAGSRESAPPGRRQRNGSSGAGSASSSTWRAQAGT